MNPTHCKHFRGTIERTCRAGVRYSSVCPDYDLPGWCNRLPCRAEPFSQAPHHLADHARRGTCAQFCLPTPAEIAADDRSIEEAIDRMREVFPVIGQVKAEHAGTNWRGTVPCPVCKTGTLGLSHSTNGHVWGKCTTPGCVAWME